MRIIVYGTLREGESRSHVMEGLRQSGSSEIVTLEGLKMYSFGGFPGVIVTNSPQDKIVAEVIDGELSAEREETLNVRLDHIEGVRQNKDGEDIGLYKRVTWDTPKGPALIYVFNREVPRDAPVIIDWLKRNSNVEKAMVAAE
jgi:gamma-glutamylcyclotransferase (GGCT)/AIG2-like uncharacterized protein YtfP